MLEAIPAVVVQKVVADALPQPKGVMSFVLGLALQARRVEQTIAEGGLTHGARRLIGPITAHFAHEKTPEVLANAPVLIIATHHGFGIVQPSAILAALPKRENTALAIDAQKAALVGQNIRRYLIPFAIDGEVQQAYGKLSSIVRPQLFSTQQSRQINRKGLQEASKRIQNGDAVVFFPDGAGAKNSRPWKRGIDAILRQLDPQTAIVFAHVDDVHPGRFIPGVGRLFTEPRVVFSQPHQAQEFLGNDITESLRTAYDAFVAQYF